MLTRIIYIYLMLLTVPVAAQQHQYNYAQIPVGKGWANNSVNVTVFRKNALVTYGDTQFIAYYNPDKFVVLGKRRLGTRRWELKQTPYKGNTDDAHNVISIMVDGDGFLHMAWDHHNNQLHYCRSIAPGSLELTSEMPMTGQHENKVSYPEFYTLADGSLLFIYRDGASGQGNLVMNKYSTAERQWVQIQSNLIDGEGMRSAYWQACVGETGTIHISWVWRESSDVATNHDICYMQSKDGGKTWLKSTGEAYILPVTAASAELAWGIPQRSELINQTAMFADAEGHPYIATYWRETGTTVPQYHLVYHSGTRWKVCNLGFRKTAFSLSGTGTKKVPISRPQVLAWKKKGRLTAMLVFRDEERNNRVSAALCEDLSKNKWRLKDLSDSSVGSWEPAFDTELWKNKKVLDLFVQNAEQKDGEGKAAILPQLVSVLEWKPDTVSAIAAKRHGLPTSAKEVKSIIEKVNNHWQATHPATTRAFWDEAAYQTGNMEAYFVTGNGQYRQYAETWAEHNQWKGARSDKKSEWKYSYGESDEYVLFGDWQICFQTYIDLYCIDKDPQKIARAREVMEFEMNTSAHDYWWWVDGLYMVMPVMTKLYKITGNQQYLDKLYEYLSWSNSILYDSTEKLYYRDAKYVYPRHKTLNGKKDFWARGDGWVFAGLAKVLQDLPKADLHRKEYIKIFNGIAAAIKKTQQPEGYWSRSILDPDHAPGPETSGTAFFTYGLLWGINNGLLNKAEYLPVVARSWRFLTTTAMQENGSVGYVQPIGERAIPGQQVSQESTSNFGVGAFLLAACEMYRHLGGKNNYKSK